MSNFCLDELDFHSKCRENDQEASFDLKALQFVLLSALMQNNMRKKDEEEFMLHCVYK